MGTIFNGMIPIVGDFNGNGKPDLITNLASAVYAVEWMGTGWQMPIGVPPVQLVNYLVTSHFALADFGTPMAGGGFDATDPGRHRGDRLHRGGDRAAGSRSSR